MPARSERSRTKSGIASQTQITPLVIILSFVLLTELVITVGIIGTKDAPQMILSVFAVSFPIIVAVPFFLLLSKKPWVFYAPKDYGQNIEPSAYIDAISRTTYVQARESTENFLTSLPQLIEQTVSRQLEENKDLFRKVNITESRPRKDTDVMDIIKNLSHSVADSVVRSNFLFVDITKFGGGTLNLPLNDRSTASGVLDTIYVNISEDWPLPIYTYDIKWVLQDIETGKLLRDMGNTWARKNGRQSDDRSLSEVGINPGMKLKAIPI